MDTQCRMSKITDTVTHGIQHSEELWSVTGGSPGPADTKDTTHTTIYICSKPGVPYLWQLFHCCLLTERGTPQASGTFCGWMGAFLSIYEGRIHWAAHFRCMHFSKSSNISS